MAAGDVVARHDPPVAPRCGRRTRARAGTSGCGASGRHDLLLERPRPAVALRDGPRRFDGQAGLPDAAEREAADAVAGREVARVRRRLARQGADERLRRADRPPGRHWPPDARRHRRVRARSRMVAGREGGQLLPPGGGRLATLVDLGRPAGRGRRQEARARPVRPVVARRPTARPRRADRRLRRGSIRPRPLRTRTCPPHGDARAGTARGLVAGRPIRALHALSVGRPRRERLRRRRRRIERASTHAGNGRGCGRSLVARRAADSLHERSRRARAGLRHAVRWTRAAQPLARPLRRHGHGWR